MPKRTVTLTIALAALVLVPALAGAYTPETLKVSAIPDENPSELLRVYAPFAEYLGKQIGKKVQFVPVVDYAATVEGLAAKKLDLVWYGGFTSVQAVRRTDGKATRLAMRREDAEFKSVFVTRRDGPVKSLADLKGKTFAFGSVSSTSGHLMPRFFLLKNGIDPDRDFGQKPAFSGAHDATALWVESGKVDAGALNFLVWDKLVETKKIDPTKVAVFWTTPPYVDYVWTAHAELDPGLRERIAQAFLRLRYDNPEDRKLLDLHRTKGYIKAADEDWKGIEEAAVAAGLLELGPFRPMYDLVGVGKSFDGRGVALADVTLRVKRGERVALIGPSGAGKTTLFRILNLTLRPTAGDLRVDGTDMARLSGPGLRALRRRIGTVYQQHNLVGRLRVVHNVLAGHLGRWSTARALLSLAVPQDVPSAAAALRRVGIAEKLYARTDTLSGGQQQRVAIARVLVQDPDVILGDEPVSSVDPSLAASLVGLLNELSRSTGKTLLMNLHSVDLALAFFPRIVGVRAGRVAFDLPPEEVVPGLLETLYAGAAREDAPLPDYESAAATSRVCRPVPGLQ